MFFYTLGLQQQEILSYNKKENTYDRLLAILNQCVVLEPLDAKQRMEIAQHSYCFCFQKNQVILHGKQQNYGVYIVIEGQIEVDRILSG